jgi:hypothetical protein
MSSATKHFIRHYTHHAHHDHGRRADVEPAVPEQVAA